MYSLEIVLSIQSVILRNIVHKTQHCIFFNIFRKHCAHNFFILVIEPPRPSSCTLHSRLLASARWYTMYYLMSCSTETNYVTSLSGCSFPEKQALSTDISQGAMCLPVVKLIDWVCLIFFYHSPLFSHFFQILTLTSCIFSVSFVCVLPNSSLYSFSASGEILSSMISDLSSISLVG